MFPRQRRQSPPRHSASKAQRHYLRAQEERRENCWPTTRLLTALPPLTLLASQGLKKREGIDFYLAFYDLVLIFDP